MFVHQLINGLMLGSTYSLLAIGYTLIIGLLERINLAHGDSFMFAAFIGLAVTTAGLPLWLTLIVAVVAGAVVSLVIERLCFRPLQKAHQITPILSTIAFGIFLRGIATQIWGSEPIRYPQAVEVTQFTIGPLVISSIHVLILAISLTMMIALDQFIHRTSMGRAMRATSESSETAGLMGVNVNWVIIFTFLVAGALAGLAGVLTALVYLQVTPLIGVRQGLMGIVAIAVGGLGSVRGAMVGGLLIGVIEVMNDAYFTASYRDIVIFGLFFIFIVFKPEGLFGMGKAKD